MLHTAAVLRLCHQRRAVSSYVHSAVIRHDGTVQHVETHYARRELKSLPDPFTRTLVISPADGILSAKKATPNTAINAVDNVDFVIGTTLSTIQMPLITFTQRVPL